MGAWGTGLYSGDFATDLRGMVRAVTRLPFSADRLVDQRTGQPYFNVTITVDRAALKDYTAVRLIPGLPADVAIATGTRTMMDYFLAPVMDVIQKGMRER